MSLFLRKLGRKFDAVRNGSRRPQRNKSAILGSSTGGDEGKDKPRQTSCDMIFVCLGALVHGPVHVLEASSSRSSNIWWTQLHFSG